LDDIRWFAPNRFCTLVVPRLREHGLAIALDGDRPARLAIAMDAQVAAAAYRYAVRHRCLFLHYVWDLPPWWLGRGRHDWVWLVAGHYLRLPWWGRRYTARRGFYSRLRFAAAHACAVWVPSAATAASVRQRFGVDCRQVPFCYDSDRFTPAPPAPPAPPAQSAGLLSVSRLEPHKNHAAVIRAAARVQPRMPVRIIGSGPERGALERQAAELGVPCTIESDVSEKEVLEAYRVAEVVVCPSRFEGFGLTPMEGIACGIPTVASDIPPHREFLGASPHFFTLDDDDSLVAAIAAARAGPPPSRDGLSRLSIDAAAQRFLGGLTPYLR
jgi:glycosyltransferase involved in cell wall biosynthesis